MKNFETALKQLMANSLTWDVEDAKPISTKTAALVRCLLDRIRLCALPDGTVDLHWKPTDGFELLINVKEDGTFNYYADAGKLNTNCIKGKGHV